MGKIMSLYLPDETYDNLKRIAKHGNVSRVVRKLINSAVITSGSVGYMKKRIQEIDDEINTLTSEKNTFLTQLNDDYGTTEISEVEKKQGEEEEMNKEKDAEIMAAAIAQNVKEYTKSWHDPQMNPENFIDGKLEVLNKQLTKPLTEEEYLVQVMEPAKKEAYK